MQVELYSVSLSFSSSPPFISASLPLPTTNSYSSVSTHGSLEPSSVYPIVKNEEEAIFTARPTQKLPF